MSAEPLSTANHALALAVALPPLKMERRTEHIDVCVCTYKRPEYLGRLLRELTQQETDGLFTYSISIVDNDELRSADQVVSDFAAGSKIPIRYCVEPRQNIALARNMAVANAEGDYIAFIDDDEFPTKEWLLTLYKTRRKYGADGVLGPVKRHFDQAPPSWVIKGNFYNRPSYPTGFVIDWKKGRTGNVLLKKEVFADEAEPFRAQFSTGEDQDFFRRMIEKGHVFIWCDEAVAYEIVPPTRCRRAFMLKRALLRGATSLEHASFGFRDIATSLVAVPIYLIVLPFAFFCGHHRFMDFLIRLFDHLGRLLAVAGIRPVRDQYVTN